MLDQHFVILGAVINFIGVLSYLVDTLKGKVKPNRVTWFLWALAPLIAFAAEIHEGVGLQSLMTFVVGFSPLLVFGASFFNKKSKWKITVFDILCGSLSLLGLLAWYVTQAGNVAIWFSILADLLAGLPTIIKSYKHPETENYQAYLFSMLNAGITLLTIKIWNFATYGFPAYIFVISFIIFYFVAFKPRNKFVSSKR